MTEPEDFRTCIINMFISGADSWKDVVDYTINFKDIELGVTKDQSLVLLDTDLEQCFDDKENLHRFRTMLQYCEIYDIVPGLYVNHETVKYEQHEYKGTEYNILDFLENLCVQYNRSMMYLIDAGMSPIAQSQYKTFFKKFVANIWIETSYSDKVLVNTWVKHERFNPDHQHKVHLLCDQSYVKYPFLCFMSRSKFTRLTLYTESNKLGFWDTNPYMTYKDFNQEGEVESPVFKLLMNSEHYRDDPEGLKILSEFKNREQKTAPGEFFYDSLKNWPCGIGGVGFPASTKSIQENFMTISAESEDKTANYFITEKTIQPMFNLMPVTILGQPGINGFMESVGFDMFKDIVDYDLWDGEEDSVVRAKKFTRAIYDSVVVDFDNFMKDKIQRQQELAERLYNNYNKMYALKNRMSSQKIQSISNIVDNNSLEVSRMLLWLKEQA